MRIIEAASWWMVSELQKISGGAFTVREEHEGNNYDTLTLYDRDKCRIMSFNRPGHLHIWATMDHKPVKGLDGDGWRMMNIWREMAGGAHPREQVNEIATIIGLPVPDPLPPPNEAVLMCGFIACFLKQFVFEAASYTCRSGYGDGAIIPYDIRSHLFEPFPEPLERLNHCRGRKKALEFVLDFWFVLKEGEPLICLETNGKMYLRSPLARGCSFEASQGDVPDPAGGKERDSTFPADGGHCEPGFEGEPLRGNLAVNPRPPGSPRGARVLPHFGTNLDLMELYKENGGNMLKVVAEVMGERV